MADMVGIDFGTSTSKMARYVGGELQHIRIPSNKGSDPLVPSIITFAPDEGEIYVAWDAHARRVSMVPFTYPSVARGHGPIKLNLVAPEAEFAPFVPPPGSTFHKPRYEAVDMAEELFVYMADKYAEFTGELLSEALLSVPAYFTTEEIHRIAAAAERAGIYVPQTVPEPVGAALSAHHSDGLEGVIAVYDFGGGTFDTTVMRVSPGNYQVLAKLGNPRLGGYLLDTMLYNELVRPPAETCTGFSLALDEPGRHPEGYDVHNRHWLFDATEAAKIALSSVETYTQSLQLWTATGEKKTLELTITRARLDGVIRPMIAATIETVQKVIRQAGQTVDEIDHFIAVGGVARMPIVRNYLRDFAGQDRLFMPRDPDMAVVEGVALLSGSQDRSAVKVSDVLARDLRGRVPQSMDTNVILRAGTPTTEAENTLTFEWPGAHTKEAHLDLCEGGEMSYQKNQPLGTLRLRPQPALQRGTLIEVTFRFDPDASAYSVEAHPKDGAGVVDAEIQAEGATPTHGAEAIGQIDVERYDMVVCIDVSRSFRAALLDNVKTECLRVEEALRSNDLDYRIGIIAFADAEVPGETPLTMSFSSMERALNGRLSSLPEFDGGDAPEQAGDALHRACTMMQTSYPDATRLVLLFTDARPSDPDKLRALAGRFSDAQARVYVFAPTNPYEEAYREIAEQTRGKYFDIYEELTDGMDEIAARVSPNARRAINA